MPKIPAQLIGTFAPIVDRHYTRKQFVALFLAVGAPEEEPFGTNKVDTVMQWLRRINSECLEPLSVFAGLLEDFFDGEPRNSPNELEADRTQMQKKLAEVGVRYIAGRVVSLSQGPGSRSLEVMLQQRDFPAVIEEFERATTAVEASPREAASAAANILEAICKEYLAQHPEIQVPKKKDLGPVFDAVRADLRLDPSSIEDGDLRRVLAGLGSVVDGIGAFRSHASSAHAQSTSMKRYKVTPRHARLVVGSAHVVVAFSSKPGRSARLNNWCDGAGARIRDPRTTSKCALHIREKYCGVASR